MNHTDVVWSYSFISVCCCVSGVPAVFMAVTLGATYRVDNPLGYRQEEL